MAGDYFLNIPGVPGASTDSEHKNWIEVLSYSHRVEQSAGENRSQGKVTTEGRCDHKNFKIVKKLDKTSPTLDLLCCQGTTIDGDVILQICSKKAPYMEYVMEEAIISSVTVDSGGEEERPNETVTFNYGKLSWKYHEPDGTVEKSWDLRDNTGS